MRKVWSRILVFGSASAMVATPILSSPAMAGTAAMAGPRAMAGTTAYRAPAGTATATRHPTLHPGDSGPAVKQLQQRLIQLHFDPGTVDGVWGGGQSNTTTAVWAFQKVNHIPISSHPIVGTKTWWALDHPVTPRPIVRRGARNRVEVDLKHQLLYLYHGGKITLISHLSSGSGETYTDNGQTYRAITPTGNYRILWKHWGEETSSLGHLWNSNYFRSDGYAIHGEPDVPSYPASHGCVRVPMHTSVILYKLLPVGLAVYVR